MTDIELKNLKDRLWHSADILRAGAHLAANKYGQPILGLIFLRYADILYKQHKDEINAEFEKLKGTRRARTLKEISIEKCGFYLPECAYFDFINDAPDDAKKATLVKRAMKAIEDENEKMEGVLPKDVYAQLVPEEEPDIHLPVIGLISSVSTALPASCDFLSIVCSPNPHFSSFRISVFGMEETFLIPVRIFPSSHSKTRTIERYGSISASSCLSRLFIATLP